MTGSTVHLCVLQIGTSQVRHTPYPQFSHDSQHVVLVTVTGGVEVYSVTDGLIVNEYDINRFVFRVLNHLHRGVKLLRCYRV